MTGPAAVVGDVDSTVRLSVRLSAPMAARIAEVRAARGYVTISETARELLADALARPVQR